MALFPPLWKSVWRILRKLKPDLSYDPAIRLLGIRHSSIHDPVMKVRYVYMMKFYSAVKKNKTVKGTKKWMELENIE